MRFSQDLHTFAATVCLAIAPMACSQAIDSGELEGDPTASVTVLPEGAQAISLLGQPLYPSTDTTEVVTQQIADRAGARIAYDADPNDADAIIWLGRRTAYLGLYREAIEIFTEGIRKHPGDARMYRHRGHRYISVREFDLAIADLSHGADLVRGTEDTVEPDGQPNERGIPTSSLHSNIHYHLALAYYLNGDFEAALDSYQDYMDVVTNPDMLVAISHWWYMALRRLDRDAEANQVLETISADLAVIENQSYHQLLLMYKGDSAADDLWDPTSQDPSGVAIAYGVANWHFYHKRTEQAVDAFRQIIAGTGWAGFGYIAAEAELARMEK